MAWLVVLHAAGGLVLVLAGLGKLRSPEPVAAALRSLRLPSGLVAIGLIAGAEIVIGVAGALAGGSAMAWVVAGEWALLGVVAAVLSSRPNVPCGCFGAPTEAAGPLHVAVDVAFAGIAVATALTAEESLADAADDARGGWVGIVVAVVLLAVAVRRLLAGRPREDAAPSTMPVPATAPVPSAAAGADSELPAVAAVPGLSGVTPDGSPIHITLHANARPTLLAFLSDTCVTCREFWTAFAAHRVPPGIDVVVVTMGPEDDSPELIARLAPRSIPTVMSSEAWDQYGVAAGPYFVLVDASGDVRAHGPASTWGSLEALLSS